MAELRDSLVLATVAHAGALGYVILFLAVAASWIGVPIVGAGALAAAGVLASEGELNIWLVLIVASVAAWTGGYVGYRLGRGAAAVFKERGGRWQRQRRQALARGEHIYGRWGRIAVFLTPTWVSGALRMPQNRFLFWNALAAIISTLAATLGAYSIGAAVLGRLSAGSGVIAVVAAIVTLAAVALALHRWWRRAHVPPGSSASQIDQVGGPPRTAPAERGRQASGSRSD